MIILVIFLVVLDQFTSEEGTKIPGSQIMFNGTTGFYLHDKFVQSLKLVQQSHLIFSNCFVWPENNISCINIVNHYTLGC